MPRIYDEEDIEEDDEDAELDDDEESGDADDDESADDESEDDSDDESEPEDDDDGELADPDEDGEEAAAATVRARRRRSSAARARGVTAMGRPSTGPKVRRPAARAVAALGSAPERETVSGATPVEPETELAPDISSWPGTSEAAKMVGRHTSTIKLWRNQSRIRALQDQSGCWRYHPDDLAEAVDTPDHTDPASALASGMTAIVSQGAAANERLLAMTELSVDGLKETVVLLREELKRVYARNSVLEELLGKERERSISTHTEDLKHERYMRRLDQKHEMSLAGAAETSQRLAGLLQVLGPIAASIGARVLGNIAGAEALEAAAAGAGSKTANASAAPDPAAPKTDSPHPAPPSEDRLVPLETKITDAMARLCDAIRRLDRPQFAGLRAMLPANVASALDAIVAAHDDGTVGRALAVIVQSAQGLSDLQFTALRPIAPADVAAILGELRVLLKGAQSEG